MKDKKKPNYFKIVIMTFFIIYLSLYFLNYSSYYEKRRGKVEFTNSQIEKFEADVENGKNVDIESYLVNQNKDYSNKISNIGYNFSSVIDYIINKGLRSITSIFKSLFT